jgi:hypothetical protein
MKHLGKISGIDFTKPLVHWSEFYESNLGIQAIWTKGSFAQLLKTNRNFFGQSIANVRSGTFLTEEFPVLLNVWLLEKRPNNLKNLSSPEQK